MGLLFSLLNHFNYLYDACFLEWQGYNIYKYYGVEIVMVIVFYF
jgi:hypothetical protein